MSRLSDETDPAMSSDEAAPPLPLSYERQRPAPPNPPDGMVAAFSMGMGVGAPLGFLAVVVRTAGFRDSGWMDTVAISVLASAYAMIATAISGTCFIRIRAAFAADFSAEGHLTAAADRYCVLAGFCAGALNYPALHALARWEGTGELSAGLIMTALVIPVVSTLGGVAGLVRPVREPGR